MLLSFSAFTRHSNEVTLDGRDAFAQIRKDLIADSRHRSQKSLQIALVENDDIMPSGMLYVPFLFLHKNGVKRAKNRNTVSYF